MPDENQQTDTIMKRINFIYVLILLLPFKLFAINITMANSNDSLPLQKTAIVYTTADSTDLRLTVTDTLNFTDLNQPSEGEPCIFIDPSKTFQTFIGIGGALTDAAAETYARLPKKMQRQIMQDYFDPGKGIGYTLARTNINSCDFSSDSYTYVNTNDTSLQTFNVKHDEQYRIPFIKDAIAASHGRLTIFASPWSPPAWMKDNHDMLHGGKLLASCYQSWANYYVQFINAYKKEGIPIWGLTVQNEPMAVQRWESCNYSADEEKDFIKNYLGPTLWKAGMQNIHIIGWDHNRDLLYQRASTLLEDSSAARYIWGIGFHWYETWTGGEQLFNNVKRVAEAFPNTHLIFTEGCIDGFDSSRINSWSFGEKYAHSMIEDFNNGTTGWTDWNILLDEKGGPNHVGNFCFAPIHADTKTGILHYLSSFYYIGHFSKFICPGAKRIACSGNRSQLPATAFINPDGKIAVIVMNPGNQKINYHLWIDEKAVLLTSLAHSIQTLIVQ
jgi:glucosylceramidase